MTEKQIILLDSAIISIFPTILDFKSPNYDLVTTSYVVKDIRSNFNVFHTKRIKTQILLAIERARETHILDVVDVNVDIPYPVETGRFYKQLSTSETSIIDISHKLKEKGTIFIATINSDLENIARSYNVKTLGLKDLMVIYSHESKVSMEELLAKTYYNPREITNIIGRFLIGIFTFLIFLAIYFYRLRILEILTVPLTIMFAILIALLLYLFRERERISYGVVEFLVGIATVTTIYLPSFSIENIQVNLSFGIRYIGGIYIMIRGLDNIVKGLSKTKFGILLKVKYGIGL